MKKELKTLSSKLLFQAMMDIATTLLARPPEPVDLVVGKKKPATKKKSSIKSVETKL